MTGLTRGSVVPAEGTAQAKVGKQGWAWELECPGVSGAWGLRRKRETGNGSERGGSAQRQLDREGLDCQSVSTNGHDAGILDSCLAP